MLIGNYVIKTGINSGKLRSIGWKNKREKNKERDYIVTTRRNINFENMDLQMLFNLGIDTEMKAMATKNRKKYKVFKI